MDHCDCLVVLGLELYRKVVKEGSIDEQGRLIFESCFPEWKWCRFLSEPLIAYRRGLWTDENERGTNAVWDWGFETRNFRVGNLIGLRSWGYVLWDECRIRDWNVLKKHPQEVDKICLSRLAASGLY
jgi:hypothetical protein